MGTGTFGGGRSSNQMRKLGADGVADLTSSTAWRAWLDVQRRFHRYSWGNTLLIYVMGNITPS